MAIIYSYPDKSSPSLSDKIIITDVESTPANQTKRCTIQGLADAISGQFTLQEVLQAGSSAIGETGDAWSGNMSLTEDGPFILPRIARRWIVDLNSLTGSGSDKVAYLVGDMQIAGDGDTKTGDLDMSGNLTVATNGNIGGNLNMTGLTGDVILNGGNFTATAGKQTKFQASTAVGGGFYFDTNGNATAGFTAGTVVDKLASVDFQVEGFFTVNSANSTTGDISLYAGDDMILRGSDITLQATGGSGHILDLGNYGSSSNRFDETNISAEDIIRLRTYNGNARIEFNGSTGSVNYFSALDLQTNELRLNGSAGSAGQLLASGGAGTNPTWISASDLSVENLIEAVENNTGSLITKGTPLHIAANPSGTPRVEPADASLAGTMPSSGLAYEDIPAGVGQGGQMIIAGQLEGIDTSTFSIGDVAYVASGSGYGVRPTAAGRLVQNIGIVTKVGGGTAGILQVTATGRSNDLPNNDPNALFTANATGAPTSTTGLLEVNAGSGLTTITDSFKINAVSPAGSNNTIIGNDASDLLYNTGGTANANVVLGKNSMSGGGAVGDNSSFNVAIGNQALAGNNNAVVTDPLRNTTIQNIAIGHQALSQPGGGAPTAPAGAHVRSGNIAIGYQNMPSLYGLAGTEGTNNTSIGNSAGFNMETGLENTFVGANSGNTVTTGSGNTLIGYNARTRNATDEYSVALGHDAEANSLGIALGTASRAGAGEFNINVSGSLATPRGGLLSVPAAAGPFPPAGVSPGDVYIIQDVDMVNLGGPAGQLVNIMAIA